MLSINLVRIIVLALYLFVVSIIDIKYKSLSVFLVILGIIMMSILYIFSPYNIYSLLGGIAVGIIVILISFITKEAIGIGDGMILIIIGLGVGASTIYIFLYSLIVLSICATLFIIVRKKNYKLEIPMIPFYFIGVIFQIFYDKTIL